METKLYTLAEIAKNNGKDGSKTWIIYKDNVYDVTEYLNLDEHPGGNDLITEWAGRDCTRAFDDAGHSNDAKKDFKQYKIGEVVEEERKKKQPKKTEKLVVDDQPKPDRRSFCSYLTCGLCG